MGILISFLNWTVHSINSLDCHHCCVALRITSLKFFRIGAGNNGMNIMSCFYSFKFSALIAWIVNAEMMVSTVWVLLVLDSLDTFSFRALFEICVHICLLLAYSGNLLLNWHFWRSFHLNLLMIFLKSIVLGIINCIWRLSKPHVNSKIFRRHLIQLKLILLKFINSRLIKPYALFFLFRQDHWLVLIKWFFKIVKVFFFFVQDFIRCLKVFFPFL